MRKSNCDLLAPRYADGFTLLELVIVLFLVTLIVGFSSAFLAGNLSSSRLSAVARDISSAIRYTRGLALLTGRDQALIINLDKRTYGVEGRMMRKIPANVQVAVFGPFSREIHTGTYSLVFPATGGMEGASTIVARAGNKTIYIQPDPVIGGAIIRPQGTGK